MAASSVRSSTTAHTSTQNLQGLLGYLKQEYQSPKYVTLCSAEHGRIKTDDPFIAYVGYSEEMEKVATTVFECLQKAARSGKKSATIKIDASYPMEMIMRCVYFLSK